MVYEKLSYIPNICLIEPVSYPDFVWLMKKSCLIISDSGGIQEEAPTLKIPVLVTRNVTERMESVNAGFAFLVGTEVNIIVNQAIKILESTPDYLSKENPYGSGDASYRILEVLKSKDNFSLT